MAEAARFGSGSSWLGVAERSKSRAGGTETRPLRKRAVPAPLGVGVEGAVRVLASSSGHRGESKRGVSQTVGDRVDSTEALPEV